MKYLSAVLRQLRARKNIYQKELAAYLHTSIGTVSNYEAGIHEPDLATLVKIAEYYDVSIDFLLGRTVCPTFTDMGSLSISDTYTINSRQPTTCTRSATISCPTKTAVDVCHNTPKPAFKMLSLLHTRYHFPLQRSAPFNLFFCFFTGIIVICNLFRYCHIPCSFIVLFSNLMNIFYRKIRANNQCFHNHSSLSNNTDGLIISIPL